MMKGKRIEKESSGKGGKENLFLLSYNIFHLLSIIEVICTVVHIQYRIVKY